MVEKLIYDLKSGYFLTWEAVIREEQRLPLTKKQEKMLSELISFSEEEDDDRILYIDESPRPSEPWHQILVKVVSHLLIDRFKTYDIYHEVVTGGWPKLVEYLEKYGEDLSLPEGVKYPIDVVPAEIQHKLWIQHCFDELYGLGQENKITLELGRPNWLGNLSRFLDPQVSGFSTCNPLLRRISRGPKTGKRIGIILGLFGHPTLECEEQQYRIDQFTTSLKEYKDSVQYLDLTLEKILTTLILPPKDEEIFVRMMIEKLGLTSTKDRIADFLE